MTGDQPRPRPCTGRVRALWRRDPNAEATKLPSRHTVALISCSRANGDPGIPGIPRGPPLARTIRHANLPQLPSQPRRRRSSQRHRGDRRDRTIQTPPPAPPQPTRNHPGPRPAPPQRCSDPRHPFPARLRKPTGLRGLDSAVWTPHFKPLLLPGGPAEGNGLSR